VRTTVPHHGIIAALNHLRAKIVKLNSLRFQTTRPENEASVLFRGEHPTLYQAIRRQNLNAPRLVRSVRDAEVSIHTSPSGIAK
jgi:hypothetical protein